MKCKAWWTWHFKIFVCKDKFYVEEHALWQSWCHMGQLYFCSVMDYKVQQTVYNSTDHTRGQSCTSVVGLTALWSLYRFCCATKYKAEWRCWLRDRNVTDSADQRISDQCGLYSIMGSALLWTVWLRVLQHDGFKSTMDFQGSRFLILPCWVLNVNDSVDSRVLGTWAGHKNAWREHLWNLWKCDF